MEINSASHFESVDKKWADQLAIYTWALENEVGAPVIIGIDQLVGKRIEGAKPQIRVARHRSTISKDYQIGLFKRANFLWQHVKKGHLFHDLDYEQNRRRYQALKNYSKEATQRRPNSIDWLRDLMKEQAED